MSKQPTAVEALLGHVFADPDLLAEALTHPSALAQGRNDRKPDYERLEFLGDRVLGLVMATHIYTEHQSAPAGEMAKRFNQMVQRDTLARVALDIGLNSHIRMSDSERRTGGAEKPAIVADICEAVIGALYLDGGLAVAEAFVLKHWQGLLAGQVRIPREPKTALQEWAHAHNIDPPVYEIVSRDGPDHAPSFVVRASLSIGMAEATGASKKEAERSAAATLLEQVAQDE